MATVHQDLPRRHPVKTTTAGTLKEILIGGRINEGTRNLSARCARRMATTAPRTSTIQKAEIDGRTGVMTRASR